VSRNSARCRRFTCLDCSHEFVATYWLRKLTSPDADIAGRQFATLGDIRCPSCGSHRLTMDDFAARMSRTTPARLAASLRPVVYRWHDADGREHFRYPASADPSVVSQRPGEERVEFETLRKMESFLQHENPGYRDWNVPLNDILDYDEAHIDIPALDTTDPGVAEEADEILSVDDFGVTTEAEVAEFMARTDGPALIEQK
jgi:DNA-directed RNA polymerase subunit RPC12/RpoP